MNADKIVVIDNGQITEAGTHKELFDKKGKYYELWQQNSKNTVNDKGETVKTERSDLLIDINDEEVLETMRSLQSENEARKAASTGKAKAIDTLAGLSLPPPKDASGSQSRSESPSRLKPDAAPFIPRSYSVSSFYTGTDYSGGTSRNDSVDNLSKTSAPKSGSSTAVGISQKPSDATIAASGTDSQGGNTTHKRRRRRRSRKNRNLEGAHATTQPPAAPLIPIVSTLPSVPVAPSVPIASVAPIASVVPATTVTKVAPTTSVAPTPVKQALSITPPASLPPKPPAPVSIRSVRPLVQVKKSDENKPHAPKSAAQTQMAAQFNGNERASSSTAKAVATPVTRPQSADGGKNATQGKINNNNNNSMKRRSRGTLTSKSNSMPTPATSGMTTPVSGSGTATPANGLVNNSKDSSVKK